MEEHELRARVALVLADLPEKYRSIIVMREMEGVAAEDIQRAPSASTSSTTRWRLAPGCPPAVPPGLDRPLRRKEA